MREGKKINGLVFYSSYSLIDFFFKQDVFGFSKKLLNIFSKRLETRVEKKTKNLKTSQMFVTNLVLRSMVPDNKDIKNRTAINIYMLDLINTYRGARHSFGLPVRGQRTWTNAWSCYKSNTILRQFRLKILKRLYITASIKELNTSYFAEVLNSLYKLQWESEWKEAKRQRVAEAKRNRNRYKIDLDTLATGNVSIKGKKKKKTYLIGFDPGFTKFVLRESIRFKLKNKKNLKNRI